MVRLGTRLPHRNEGDSCMSDKEERLVFDVGEHPTNCPRCQVLIFVPGIGSMIAEATGVGQMSRYRCKVCRQVWFVRHDPDGMPMA